MLTCASPGRRTAAVQRAVEDASPGFNKAIVYRERAARIQAELDEVTTGRDRILKLIVKGTITEPQAEGQLRELSEREKPLADELARLLGELDNAPTPEDVRAAEEQTVAAFADHIPSAKLWAKSAGLNDDLAGMTWEDKRKLLEMVFGGKTSEGGRMGVYVRWLEGQRERRRKRWGYQINGHLIKQGCVVPHTPNQRIHPEDGEFCGGPLQGALLEVVSESPSY